MHPQIHEVLDLTRQYTDTLKELSQTRDEHERLMDDFKRRNVSPPYGAFSHIRDRIRRATDLLAALRIALNALSSTGGAQ